jgi:hypothetical protein
LPRERAFCQEKGHFSRDCPKKKTKNESSKTTKSNHTLNGTARCAKEQGSESLHDDEALTSSSFIVCGRSDWIIDSRATQHMTLEQDALVDYVEFKQPSVVNLGDNRSILAYSKITYHINAVVDDHIQNISLPYCPIRDILYLPDLDKNLLSVHAMIKLGAVVSFEDDIIYFLTT